MLPIPPRPQRSWLTEEEQDEIAAETLKAWRAYLAAKQTAAPSTLPKRKKNDQN